MLPAAGPDPAQETLRLDHRRREALLPRHDRRARAGRSAAYHEHVERAEQGQRLRLQRHMAARLLFGQSVGAQREIHAQNLKLKELRTKLIKIRKPE
ncbi:MAG: hypothetical protein M5U26_23540 [Planctomycetota bacterium]|nr:hypothetical protein [Planctomycetota bacterium]